MQKVIICVDDEKIVLNSLQAMLARKLSKGFELEFVQSAYEALELIQEYEDEDHGQVSVIISDWMMPKMKGDEFLEKVKSLNPKVKAILLSGQADPKAIKNAINNSWVDHFVQKPWEEEELINCILS